MGGREERDDPSLFGSQPTDSDSNIDHDSLSNGDRDSLSNIGHDHISNQNPNRGNRSTLAVAPRVQWLDG
jgi:hypothetical protein